MHQLLLFPHAPPSEPEPPLLSPDLQDEVLAILLRGGSPQSACQKLRLDPRAFCRTAEFDAGFRDRLRHARELMTQNVVATVYAAAMKGTPAAQALWLRTFPPLQLTPTTFTDPDNEPNDEFSAYSTEDLARQIAVYSRISASESERES